MLRKIIISLAFIIFFSSITVFAETVQPSIELEVSSEVAGDKTDEEELFAFKLISLDPENPIPNTDEVFITGSGSISFGKMIFEKPNLYKYELCQIKGNSENYIYDETVYEISVYVTTDKNNVLMPTVIVNKKGSEEKSSSLTFTNIYTKVEEEPENPETSDPPITGDNTNVLWYILVTIISLSIIIYLVFKKKKHK